MTPEPFSGPRYHKNAMAAGSAEPCAICGKAVKDENAPRAEVLDGGARFALEGETPDTNDAGYMGTFPVGPECVRKLRRAGVKIEEPGS